MNDAIRDDPLGIIILPIDAIGMKEMTIHAIAETALRNPHLKAIVPEYDGRGGHPIYVSNDFARELLLLDPKKPNSRLDRMLEEEPDQMRLPVGDPAILTNINTPGEWEKCKP